MVLILKKPTCVNIENKKKSASDLDLMCKDCKVDYCRFSTVFKFVAADRQKQQNTSGLSLPEV